jgi:hypothetical protein
MRKIIVRISVFTIAAALAALVAVMPQTGGSTVRADAPAPIRYVLDSCDTPDNFTNVQSPDRTNFIEGTGCVYSSGSVPTISAIFRNVEHDKLPPFSKAYVEFYVYVEDVDNIYESQFELNSTGANDIFERSFSFSKTTAPIGNGWNFLSLKLDEFAETSPTNPFNYNELVGMRLYIVTKSGLNAVRLDDIVITDTPTIDAVRAAGIHPKSTAKPVIDLVVKDDVANPGNRPLLTWLAGGGAAAAVLLFAGSTVVLVLKKKKAAQ